MRTYRRCDPGVLGARVVWTTADGESGSAGRVIAVRSSDSGGVLPSASSATRWPQPLTSSPRQARCPPVRRAPPALVVACVIIALAVVTTLVLLLLMAFSSMPAGCGFDSSDACTNPNANDTQIAITGFLIALGAVGGTTALVTATTGWVLGAARPVLRSRVLVGFAAVLVVAVGVGSVVVGFIVGQTAVRIVLATVIAVVVVGWPIALARVQHIARNQSP